MEKEFSIEMLRQNLECAIEDAQYLKSDDRNLRFRIETNVHDAKVRLMIIRSNKIIEVKTFDENGEQSSRMVENIEREEKE